MRLALITEKFSAYINATATRVKSVKDGRYADLIYIIFEAGKIRSSSANNAILWWEPSSINRSL